jgi:hypothetical protein
MTENTRRTTTAPEMKSVDHTHPDTDRPFGERVVFERGPVVAADGGEPSEVVREAQSASRDDERAKLSRTTRRTSEDGTSSGSERGVASEKKTDESEPETEAEKQMKDVDHEPPNEAEANRVFERGREGRDDTR